MASKVQNGVLITERSIFRGIFAYLASAPHRRSKSSNLWRYLRMLRLILLESTQVTKSSMPLVTRKAGSVTTSVPTLTWPCSINLIACTLVSWRQVRSWPGLAYCLDSIGHLKPGHDHAQPASAEAAHAHFLFYFAELAPASSAGRAENAHLVELLQQESLMFAPDRVCWVQSRELMRELPVKGSKHQYV